MKYWYELNDPESFYDGFCEPGLTYSRELVEWFQQREIPNLVTDTIANEVTFDPKSGVALPLHCALMRNLGVTLTEIAWLDDLADACAADDRWSFLYVAAPAEGRERHRRTGQPGGYPMTTAAESTIYGSKPWLARYAPGQPTSITVEFDSALDMFSAAVTRESRRGDHPLLRRPDHPARARRTDRRVRRGHRRRRVHPGERVAVYLQNVPQFLIAQIGAWKAGGIAVSINPMNRERELTELLTDSGATVLVALESLYRDVAAKVVPGTERAHGDHHLGAGVPDPQ